MKHQPDDWQAMLRETPIYATMLFEQMPQRWVLGADPETFNRDEWKIAFQQRQLWVMADDFAWGTLESRTPCECTTNNLGDSCRCDCHKGLRHG